MLTIYAKSFMTATRLNTPKLRDAPRPDAPKRRRWLPENHWWLRGGRDVDVENL